MKWYKKATDQGDDKAQYNLGIMYFKGRGVQQDYVKAYSYLCIAAELKNKDAAKSLSKIQKKMTSVQVAEGQKQAEILRNKFTK